MKKRNITLYLIVMILVLKSPIIAYAESTPGTITVSGGSVGSGGVEGNSNVLKGTALTVIMATLASAGVQIKLAMDDYEHGNSAFNYLEDKFAEWESTSSQAWENYNAYRSINETKVDSQGNLYVPEAASNIMQKFINWLYANEDVKEIPHANPDASSFINGTFASNTFVMPDAQHKADFFEMNKTTSKTVALVMVPNGSVYNVYAYSTSDFISKWYYKDNGYFTYYGLVSASTNYTQYGYYFRRLENWTTNQTVNGMLIVNDLAQYFRSLNHAWEESSPSTSIDATGFYGETLDIPQLVDESGNGKILKVNPGLIGQVQDSYVGSNNASINIQDYLDALKDLYGQQALPQDITDLPDITIPGEDAITGAQEDVAVIDRELVLSPDITVPADPDAITWPEVPEGALPVSDPSVPADPEISIPAMSFDLTQYFPFCLPFDIYHILQKLNADPVTPEVTIDWGNILGAFGIDYVMHLDLHDYDNIAELLRNMETAAFVVGLAVVTRQMFLRG